MQINEKSADPHILLKTNMGNIELELNQRKAPKTVDNFLEYLKKGHYNGTIFHRVIDGFMIQGGGFDTHMAQKKTSAAIQNEANNGLENDQYTVAMARTSDPHSATAQFFINTSGRNSFLNYTSKKSSQAWGYAVFGKVVKGFDVVDKIAKVKTAIRHGHENVPIEDVIIISASIV